MTARLPRLGSETVGPLYYWIGYLVFRYRESRWPFARRLRRSAAWRQLMVTRRPDPGQRRETLVARILAGELWPPLDIAVAERRVHLQSAKNALSNLIHYLLLYDQVVIPTLDFMILVVLANILGESNLVSLLEEGTVRFVRVRGSLAYAGSGGKVHGLCALHITQTARGSSAHPYSRSLEDVIGWSLAFLPSATNRQRLAALTIEASEELPIENIQGAIKAETESDILQASASAAIFHQRILKEESCPRCVAKIFACSRLQRNTMRWTLYSLSRMGILASIWRKSYSVTILGVQYRCRSC